MMKQREDGLDGGSLEGGSDGGRAGRGNIAAYASLVNVISSVWPVQAEVTEYYMRYIP